MATITVKIKTTTTRGKHLLGLLQEMAKTGKDVEFENVPNSETIDAINDARQKKGMKAENVDDLFEQLNG
ncbi:MAG: hypothetical protein ACOC1D_04235 [Prolixibacteraceae bacterium]